MSVYEKKTIGIRQEYRHKLELQQQPQNEVLWFMNYDEEI